MRTIEQDAISAVRDGHDFKAGHCNGREWRGAYLYGYRDKLVWDGVHFEYRLWDNVIAEGNRETGRITLSSCGYATATTVSRINAVCAALDIPVSCRIQDKSVKFYLEGQETSADAFKAGTWFVTIKQ